MTVSWSVSKDAERSGIREDRKLPTGLGSMKAAAGQD